jgi:hypothetical protein
LSLKSLVSQVQQLVNELYNYYVPPFKINRVQLSEIDLQSVINDIYSKSRPAGWLRLDGTYYTTDQQTFTNIVKWDWTDTRKYITDTFDCDKFAMYFKSRISIDFGINAIGIVIDYSAGHAYNLVILKGSQGINWYLYEPQNDSIFTFESRLPSLYRMDPGLWYLIL